MASANTASAIGVRIDDVGSILKFRIGFPFGENSPDFLPVRVAPGVDTEFPYRVRIVDRGVDCRDPVCRHRFRFPRDTKSDYCDSKSLRLGVGQSPWLSPLKAPLIEYHKS